MSFGSSRPAAPPPPPPPPPPAARPERSEEMGGRAQRDEMARRRGRGAQVLAGEGTGQPATGSKTLLGQ
jgi:hypothetical protein